MKQIVSMVIKLGASQVDRFKIGTWLRVYRNSGVHRGAFSLRLWKHPWLSLSTLLPFPPYIMMLVLPLYCFSLWLDCWGRVAGRETKGLRVFTDGLAISHFFNPCSSWTRLISVEEWDQNSTVLNFLVGHRIPWILKKALDSLPS